MKRMHVHVSVANLEDSIRFYSTLFASQPSVTKPDYAKWMLDDPRVNFAISNRSHAVGIEHLGIQVENADELAAIFERHGLPFAPIRRPEELFDDPHLQVTGGLADITLPDGDRAGQTAQITLMPLRMDGQRLDVRSDPPRLGQHTAELLQGLGYTPADVAALHAAGAVA